MKTLTNCHTDTPQTVWNAGTVKPPISEAVRQRYQAAYSEMSTVQTLSEARQQDGTVTVLYQDLPQTELEGFPIGSFRDDAGRLAFAFAGKTPNTHILGIGTTGSGKTTGFVEPGLRAVSSKKNKPNLFLTDPKGELFARNAAHLRRQGYRLYLLNFKDVQHSDCWNPLAELYDIYTRQKGPETQVRREAGSGCPGGGFGDAFWACGDRAYPTETAARRAREDAVADILSETADLVHQLVHTLIPDSLQGTHDPSWFMGAQEILSGILYAMLEDALDERSGFTRDTMNLMTVQEYFDILRQDVVGRNLPLLKSKKLAHKTERHASVRQLRTYFENAPTTTRSYLGCFRNAMQGWFNNKIFTVCNGDTVRLDTDEPFAVFLITRDFEKSDFTIAGMFIDWVYRKMLEAAERNQGRSPRETFFLLDEFANIPPIKDFENKIATSRSRNIWFQLYVQSYAQLETLYGGSAAQTILDNCNTHVFLGSQNYDTKARFARECGKQTVPSMEAILNPQNKRTVEVPLLNIRKLETLRPGEMYMKRTDLPLMLTTFQRSYLCREFAEPVPITPMSMGIESAPFNAEKYRYGFLESDKTLAEYAAARQTVQVADGGLPDFLFQVV